MGKTEEIKMTFRQWLDFKFYPGFDVDSLTDEEYFDLEDEWRSYYED